MPELPEVETIAMELRQACLVGTKIIDAKVYWSRTIAQMTPQQFIQRLLGQKIIAIGRRAKFLSFKLSSGDSLFIHLRMTGRLELVKNSFSQMEHERVCL